MRNIREIFQVRPELEDLATQLVLAAPPRGAAERLLALVDEAPAQPHAGQLEVSIDAIRDFHEELVRLSANDWPGRVQKSAAKHRAIVDALASGEQAEASSRLGVHLDSLVDDYLQADGLVSLRSAAA